MSNIREKIIKELENRGANAPCPRCGRRQFTLLDDFARVDIQKNFHSISLGGPSVPCVMIACTNCGNINFHALGVLGLMDELQKINQTKEENNE